MEFVVDKIMALVSANADSDGFVSLPLLEEKMKESGFDMESTGYSYDDLLPMLEDLDAFEIDTEETPSRIRCKDFQSAETTSSEPLPESASEAVLDEATLNRKIAGTIRKLLKYNPSPDGLLMLTTLGTDLRDQGIKLPEGERLSAYLRRYSSLFEIDSETKYVRIVGSLPAPSRPTIPAPAAAPVMEKTVTPSLYNLFDFCHFADFAAACDSLVKLAVPDGWFILDDPGDKDPYFLVGIKLRMDFALSVKAKLNGVDDGFRIGLDKASFKTGFHTSEGTPIYACLAFNRSRGGKTWQSWAFDHFAIGEPSC